MAQQDMARSLAERMVYDYNRNPYGFSEEQGQNIARFAAAYNLEFKPESKALKKFFYNLVNTGTLGALSLAMDAPRETGEQYGFGTTSGKIAGGLGSLGGMITPLGVGGALGKMGLKGAAKIAPEYASKMGSGLRATAQGAGYGAGIGAAHNLIGDPSGVADRAMTGAMFGGAIGGIGGAINRFRRPEAFNMYGNEVPPLLGTRLPNVIYASGQPLKALPSGQVPQLGQGSPIALQGRVPRRMGLPSPNMQVSGNPINLGGKLPYMSDDMESITNAIRNARGQQQQGYKAAINRFKSEDNMRYMKGNPVDDQAYMRTPVYAGSHKNYAGPLADAQGIQYNRWAGPQGQTGYWF